MITQRRDEEGLKQGGGCGGEGRQKPWESLVRITARIGEQNVELGSDFFSVSSHISVPSFSLS